MGSPDGVLVQDIPDTCLKRGGVHCRSMPTGCLARPAQHIASRPWGGPLRWIAGQSGLAYLGLGVR